MILGVALRPAWPNLNGSAAAHLIVPRCAAWLGRMDLSAVTYGYQRRNVMRRMVICFLILTAFSLSRIPSSKAQESSGQKATATSSAAPTSGFRAEFLEEIAYYEQRYTRLAEAMPAEKYTWRPAEGVRSVGEVFTHITAGNYGIARALGTPPPAGFDPKAITALSAD